MLVEDLYKKALKGLMIDELMVDPGWDAMIDLILSNVDSSMLRFFSTNGFPYQVHFIDESTGGLLSSLSQQGRVQTVGDEVYVYYNQPGQSMPYLDFGTVDVECNNCFISVDGGEFGDRASFTASLTPVPFTVRFTMPAAGTPSSELPFLQLASLPESVNPVAIEEYKEENYLAFNPNMAGVSPAELWQALRDLRVAIPYRVVFQSGSDRGYTHVSYPDFVRFLRTRKLDTGVVELVSSEDVLISAQYGSTDAALQSMKWDRFGSSAYNSLIYGYDKKLWVVVDNSPEASYTFVGAGKPVPPAHGISVSPAGISVPSASSGLSYDVSVSLVDSADTWRIEDLGPVTQATESTDSARISNKISTTSVYSTQTLDSNVEPPFGDDYDLVVTDKYQDRGSDVDLSVAQYVITPDSELGEMRYGVQKVLRDMSIISGPLTHVAVVFDSVPESEFRASYPGVVEVMESILTSSVPVGVSTEVRFEYPFLESMLRITDYVPETQYFITLEGQKEYSLPQLSQSGISGGSVRVVSNSDWRVFAAGDALDVSCLVMYMPGYELTGTTLRVYWESVEHAGSYRVVLDGVQDVTVTGVLEYTFVGVGSGKHWVKVWALPEDGSSYSASYPAFFTIII